MNQAEVEQIIAERWSRENGDPLDLSLHLVRHTMAGTLAVISEQGREIARLVRQDIERLRQRRH
jgi:hypothetical protein